MNCPRCKNLMVESYDAQTGGNAMYECENCGFTEVKFDALAREEGYPTNPDEFEDWKQRHGLDR